LGEQVPVPEQSPLQLVKVDPEEATAEIVTVGLEEYVCEQVPEVEPAVIVQFIKPSLLVTMPLPVPDP
jgi:hypothetical protein